jgi:EAL domain-containing protein (putative c-di-GMP-specific phosphodiesterase class I)
VEAPEDLRELIKMNCDTAQGYLFAEPMPAGKLAATLVARSGQLMQSRIERALGDPQRLAQTA